MSRSEWADPKALRDESAPTQNQFSSAGEGALRPTQLADFTGQVRVQSQLALLIKAAKARGTSADHVLLSGPPGLGKTTLAMIMATEMSAPIRISSGPAITHAGDLAAILSSLTDGEILFIDEIHRLARPAEEMLYLAMEDFRVDIVVGKGAGATSIPLELPRFTLIGATTRAGLLPSPLRDRFGFTAQLDYYEDGELAQILARSAGLLQIQMSPEALALVASRSRGTPRIGNRLLRRVRDYAEIHHEASAIDLAQAQAALELYEVDELGLDRLDRAYLSALIEKFGGGPVGLGTMAMALSEEAETVESVCEPYLIRLGFIARTARGRAATHLAYQHLGVATPNSLSPSLFDRPDQEA